MYHLITLLIIEAGLGLAWDVHRRARLPAGGPWALGLAGVLITRLLRLGITLFEPLFHPAPPGVVSLLDHLLTFTATLLIIWAFVCPDFVKSTRWWQRYFFPAQIMLGGVGILGLLLWQFLAPAGSAPAGWGAAIWQGWQVGLYGWGLGWLIYRDRDRVAPVTLAALAGLGLGHLLHLLLPLTATGPGVERLSEVVGYPLLLVTIYQALARQVVTGEVISLKTHQREIESYQNQLRSISQEAVHQRDETLFLLEASRAVNASLDLQAVLQQIAQYIALVIQADAVVIALRQTGAADILKVVTGYDPRSKEVWEISQIQLTVDRYPMLKQALNGQSQPIIIQNVEPSAELLTLHAALGSADIGPLLIQPLCHRQQGLGVLMLGNGRRQQLFSDSDARLCQSVADHVSGAIANARLYDEVTSLLVERQEQVSQRQAILDSVTDGVIVAGKTQHILMVNPAAEAILKQPARKLLGRPLAGVCPALVEVEHAVFELNRRIIEGSHSPVYLPDQTLLGTVAVLRDVTKEREAEQSKSRFIETVSHELRTPITAIKGYTDLLSKGAVQPDSDHYQRFIGKIKTNTERLSIIVNNMIAVSEMDGQRSLNLRPVELEVVLNEALNAIEIELKHRELSLIRQFSPGLPPLTADPLRLRHVLDNLLSNAMKYTYPGGKIIVSTGIIPPEKSTGAGFVRLTIADTGVGIPAEDQARIFEKFYRAENPLQVEAGGPGVGLTVVRDIVEQHGGYIWVKSEISKGSKFNIALPVNGPLETPVAPTPEPVLAQAL